MILAFTSEEFQRMEWHGFNHLLSIPIKLHLRAQFSKHIYCYKREENKLRKRTLWVFRKVFYCWLLLFSHPVVSDCVWPHALQHARPPCPSPSPRVCPSSCPLQSVMPSSHLILWCPLPLLPSIFPTIRDFSNVSVFHIRWPKYEVSAQHQSFQRVFRVDFP